MPQTMYDVISPDGFPITCEPFKSEKEALEYVPLWCQRYQQQGYYSTSRREKILLADLPGYLSLVPITD
jgi:hypothetical protein